MMTLLANKHLKTGEFFRAMWRVTNVGVVAFYQVWTNNENWMTLDMQFCKSHKKNDNNKTIHWGFHPMARMDLVQVTSATQIGFES